jgi:hypothetical protein
MKNIHYILAIFALFLSCNEKPTDKPNDISCQEKYSPDMLCRETRDSCVFYVYLSEGTCEDYCASHGGKCLGAAWNMAYSVCEVEEITTCDDVAEDQICICTR